MCVCDSLGTIFLCIGKNVCVCVLAEYFVLFLQIHFSGLLMKCKMV